MEIRNYKQIDKGSVIGKFDLYIPLVRITIRDIKLLKSKDGREFISMPSKEYTDPQGAKKFWDYVSIDKDKKEDFREKVLALLAHFRTQSQTFDDSECPF